MGAITGAANCSVAAAQDGAFTVVKTVGTDGAFDASAVSAAGVAGDLLMRVKPLGTGLCCFGVSADPLAGNDAATIARAFRLSGSLARVSEFGVLKPGSFAIDTYAWIRRSGGVLEYLTGPDLATAALKRSIADAGAPLFFDSSIAGLGMGFEVRFGAAAEFAARRRRRSAGRLALAFGF
jgi:hypothetical protein